MTMEIIPEGTTVKFAGYAEGEEGPLKKGQILTLKDFDPEQELYNVEGEDGVADSLFPEEFEIPTSTPKKKAAKKKAAKKKAAKAAKEEQEEEPKKPVVKKKAAKKKAAKKKAAKKKAKEEKVVSFVGFTGTPTESIENIEEGTQVTILDEGSDGTVLGSVVVRGEEVVATFSRDELDLPELEKPKTKKKAAAKKKSKKKPKGVPPNARAELDQLPFKRTTTFTAALKTHGSATVAAQALVNEKAKTEYTLGGLLSYIKREDLQTEIKIPGQSDTFQPGLRGFNSYCEEVLGLKHAKAHAFVRIYEKFSHLISDAKIQKVGWTKLRSLLPLKLDENNVEDWVEKAKELSTPDLDESVREALVNGEGEIHGNSNLDKRKSFKFVAFNDQAEMWEEAIATAMPRVENTDLNDKLMRSAALNLIITEWLTMCAHDGEGAE